MELETFLLKIRCVNSQRNVGYTLTIQANVLFVSVLSISIYIKQFLLQLADGDVPDKRFGICYNLKHKFSIVEIVTVLVGDRVEGWEHYSGKMLFPVPCKGLTPYAAHDNLPLWDGEYGEKRKQLAEYLSTQDWTGVETKVSLWTKIRFHFTGYV